MLPHPPSWFDRWVESATGQQGFWPNHVPGDHFRTAATTGDALATMVVALVEHYPEIRAVVDVGAGQGELLVGLAALRPDWQLTGIDLRVRPPDLPRTIGWVRDRWDVRRHRWAAGAGAALHALDRATLVIAAEWLDDLPTVVAQRADEQWHELMDDAGRPQLGPPVSDIDRSWLVRWWPTGHRAEVGVTRDRAWGELVASMRPTGGLALMIDYGHLIADRPVGGSLAAYRHGRRAEPALGQAVNLTAPLAVDAVRAAGEDLGARTLLFAHQTQVVRDFATAPSSADPLVDLARRSERAALSSPRGLGAHWWLLQQ